VIVQTASPGSAAIRYAAAHDYIAFARDELEHRKRAGLPPITRLARIVVRDEQLPKAEQHAAELAEMLAGVAPYGELTIDGPVPCAIARIAGFHRIELVLTARRRAVIQEVLAALRSRGLLTSDAHTAIDVDPVAMM
jgi:primosomal protein N' (replication factor Y)